jgi:hypothetical protein
MIGASTIQAIENAIPQATRLNAASRWRATMAVM